MRAFWRIMGLRPTGKPKLGGGDRREGGRRPRGFLGEDHRISSGTNGCSSLSGVSPNKGRDLQRKGAESDGRMATPVSPSSHKLTLNSSTTSVHGQFTVKLTDSSRKYTDIEFVVVCQGETTNPTNIYHPPTQRIYIV